MVDLGYLAWIDDLAWMEKMTGHTWKSLLKSENDAFSESLKPLHNTIIKFQGLMKSDKLSAWSWRGWNIEDKAFSPNQEWYHTASGFKCNAWDADASDDYFAAAVEVSGGFERFTVEVYSLTDKKLRHIKTIESCGPYLAFYNNILIYLGSSKDLHYDSVKAWDPETNASSTLYEIKDPIQDLTLNRAQDGSVYITVGDFVNFSIGFIILPNKIHWIKDSFNTFFVESFSNIITDTTRFRDIPVDHVIESMSLKAGWIVTRSHGIKTLWKITDTSVELIATVWGEISFDSRDPYRLEISDVRYKSYVIDIPSWKLIKPDQYPFSFSYDNDPVPVFLVKPPLDVTIKGLLVTAYGAYGTPTRIGSLVGRWKPLLLNGWAIASVMVPGSGDHDVAWKRLGQREQRQKSINALRDSVQRLQGELEIGSTATALYGRSAGGLLVSSVAVQNPGLVGALYIESPYVDVLRTISNPRLPLTTLETREFGIGTNPVNVISTGAWSPMEHIPDEGVPDIFIVSRAGTADLEVYPYEVVKFIHRMRGDGGGYKKLLYVHSGIGHFTTSGKSRAQDLALLDAWLQGSPDVRSDKKSAVRVKNRSTKYKMAPSRKNMSRKDRKNKSRKDRKNKNEMMGGKRRSMSRKASRKGSRRH